MGAALAHRAASDVIPLDDVLGAMEAVAGLVLVMDNIPIARPAGVIADDIRLGTLAADFADLLAAAQDQACTSREGDDVDVARWLLDVLLPLSPRLDRFIEGVAARRAAAEAAQTFGAG